MKGMAILLAVLLVSIIMIGIRFKFYSIIFGEGGLLGPEDHSLSHEIKNLVKLRDQGLIDFEKYESMKEELLSRYKEFSRGADDEIKKLEKLQQQGIISPEEFEEMKKKLSKVKEQ